MGINEITKVLSDFDFSTNNISVYLRVRWVGLLYRAARNDFPHHSFQSGRENVSWLAANLCPQHFPTSMLHWEKKHCQPFLHVFVLLMLNCSWQLFVTIGPELLLHNQSICLFRLLGNTKLCTCMNVISRCINVDPRGILACFKQR